MLSIRKDLDDLTASITDRFDSFKKSGDVDSEAENSEEDEGEEEGEEEEEEKLALAKKVLKVFLGDDGNLEVSSEDILKFNKKKLIALATYLGEDYPEGGLAKVRKALTKAYEDADDNEEEEDEEEDEEEGEVIEVEFEGDKYNLEPVGEECFESKFWKKGGHGYGRTFFILDEGDPVDVDVSAVKKDSDGDKYLVAKSGNGDAYTIYSFGEDGGPLSALGLLIED